MEQAILKRIDTKLSTLLHKPVKSPETWVKASVITDLTGWSAEKMRLARDNGYITWKKENGFWYHLESLNQIFYKK